jgi:GNAT superfamily N-acetyltransferase
MTASDRGDEPAHQLGLIEKLSRHHDLSSLQCGKPSLDDWLLRFALANQQSDSTRTYVLHRGGELLGYYSLSAGSVIHEEAPARIAKGLAKHPIGVILLARLAVKQTQQRKGIGKILLSDALGRAEMAAEIIDARAVLVHALDDEAVLFYGRFGFVPSPLEPKQLMLLMKDLRASSRKAES